MKTNGPSPNDKEHNWWEPWKNSLRLINTFTAHCSAALVIIVVAAVLEYVIETVERGKELSYPNALEVVHYADLAVLVGVVVILGYKLLKGLSENDK